MRCLGERKTWISPTCYSSEVEGSSSMMVQHSWTKLQIKLADAFCIVNHKKGKSVWLSITFQWNMAQHPSDNYPTYWDQRRKRSYRSSNCQNSTWLSQERDMELPICTQNFRYNWPVIMVAPFLRWTTVPMFCFSALWILPADTSKFPWMLMPMRSLLLLNDSDYSSGRNFPLCWHSMISLLSNGWWRRCWKACIN